MVEAGANKKEDEVDHWRPLGVDSVMVGKDTQSASQRHENILPDILS